MFVIFPRSDLISLFEKRSTDAGDDEHTLKFSMINTWKQCNKLNHISKLKDLKLRAFFQI